MSEKGRMMADSIQPIQVVALPPDDVLVSSVHQIANALQKKRGYQTSISICDTRTVMEAIWLLVNHEELGVQKEGVEVGHCEP